MVWVRTAHGEPAAPTVRYVNTTITWLSPPDDDTKLNVSNLRSLHNKAVSLVQQEMECRDMLTSACWLLPGYQDKVNAYQILLQETSKSGKQFGRLKQIPQNREPGLQHYDGNITQTMKLFCRFSCNVLVVWVERWPHRWTQSHPRLYHQTDPSPNLRCTSWSASPCSTLSSS